MVRKILLLLVVYLASASSTLLALGLGEIKLKSGLNQPLDAEITLLSVRNESNDQLRGQLGSSDEFDRTGIERVYFLTKIRFETITKPNGQQVIKLTTVEPVKEPFLNFLVNLEWPNGKLLREYTLLLDPPVFDDAPRVSVAPVIRESRPEPKPTQRKAVSRPVNTKPQWQGDTYGPTSSNDTLWSIALKVRPNRSVSVQQSMITIFEANPEAFMKGNINNLKRGTELKIPDNEVFTQLSQREAMSMIATHNANWRTGKRTEPRVVMDTSNDSVYKPVNTAIKTEQGRLSLSTDSSETGKGGGSVSEAIVEEENEILKQQNDSLKIETESNAEKIQQLERLLELKNEQLANLQNRTDTATEVSSPVTTDNADVKPSSPAALNEVTPADTASSLPQNSAQDSIIDDISSGEYNLYLGIFGGVVLLLLIGAIMRRRNDDEDYNTAVVSNNSAKSIKQTAGLPKSADEVLAGSYVNDDETEEENLSDEVIDHPSESDPLGEADIYLAYGKFEQAESLLLAAIAEDPERLELSTKLLECYAEMDDIEKFESHVNSFEAEMSSDTELSKNIEDLYQTAWPEGDLFATAAENDTDMDFSDDSDATLHDYSEIEDEQEDDNFDIDADIDEVPSVEDVFGDTSDSIEENIILDMDETESIEIMSDESLELESSDDLSDDLSDETSDDIDTQLDLARAYIEMGDYEGTREIISEILESGSEEQCKEAQKILDSMDD